MAAAKVLDTIGRLPGNDAEDSDAMSAYTQVLLAEALKILQKTDPSVKFVETWVTLPKSRWPPHWHKIKDPVCKKHTRPSAIDATVPFFDLTWGVWCSSSL